MADEIKVGDRVELRGGWGDFSSSSLEWPTEVLGLYQDEYGEKAVVSAGDTKIRGVLVRALQVVEPDTFAEDLAHTVAVAVVAGELGPDHNAANTRCYKCRPIYNAAFEATLTVVGG